MPLGEGIAIASPLRDDALATDESEKWSACRRCPRCAEARAASLAAPTWADIAFRPHERRAASPAGRLRGEASAWDEHDESEPDSHEELYLVLRGRASFEVDGEQFAAPVETTAKLIALTPAPDAAPRPEPPTRWAQAHCVQATRRPGRERGTPTHNFAFPRYRTNRRTAAFTNRRHSQRLLIERTRLLFPAGSSSSPTRSCSCSPTSISIWIPAALLRAERVHDRTRRSRPGHGAVQRAHAPVTSRRRRPAARSRRRGQVLARNHVRPHLQAPLSVESGLRNRPGGGARRAAGTIAP